MKRQWCPWPDFASLAFHSSKSTRHIWMHSSQIGAPLWPATIIFAAPGGFAQNEHDGGGASFGAMWASLHSERHVKRAREVRHCGPSRSHLARSVLCWLPLDRVDDNNVDRHTSALQLEPEFLDRLQCLIRFWFPVC